MAGKRVGTMIEEREMNMNKTLCIYHGGCVDGFTSAWIVHKVYTEMGEGIDFHPGVYGEEPPDVSGRDVLMVDFSYKKAVIERMAKIASSIMILDHHKTAEEDLREYCIPSGIDGAQAIFDMNRSGAQLVWDFYYEGARPKLVDYVGDRDLWKFEMEHSRAVYAYISTLNFDFVTWTSLMASLESQAGLERAIEIGSSIERKHRMDVAELVKISQRRMVIGGYSVPVANAPFGMASDAGNAMALGKPFAATYFDTADGRLFSLRSTDGGLDVSEIAKQYGGGGHARAAGFRKEHGWEGEA